LIKKKWLPKLIDSSQILYSKSAPSVKTCENWFRRFKSGNFDLKANESLAGQQINFEDAELQTFLNKTSTQTLQELTKTLNINKSFVSNRLHIMGKIQKEGK